MSSAWKKIENEAGYPCYVDNKSTEEQYDHPQFQAILSNLGKYDDIKYSTYRIAFKVYSLQDQLKVPPLRISSGVLSRHRLSLSESSLSLEAVELEAVLADVYFAAEKEGLFVGDIDLAVDLLLNLVLNVYDRERKEPIRVLAAKTLLILLSEESSSDKWLALAKCAADHNGCVSPRRMATLLTHVAALPTYLGENDAEQYIQEDVNNCFAKSAGMLGETSEAAADWAVTNCASARWIQAMYRIHGSRTRPAADVKCDVCGDSIDQMLRFQCVKCTEMNFCENCYLYNNKMAYMNGHKNTHVVQEVVDGEVPRPQCLGFIKGVKRLFFCTKKTKRRNSVKKRSKKQTEAIENNAEVRGTSRRRNDGKPAIFTSTVGKAQGNSGNNPAVLLQDIINQLENQNKALKDLSGQLQESTKNGDEDVKRRVDTHWGQVNTQINRLKMLQDNLTMSTEMAKTEVRQNKEAAERIQDFDVCSPISVVQGELKVLDNVKSQPRVLSLDSGNFSVVSKDNQPLLTMSGDALKPVTSHTTTDSISTVSMNDISLWYNDADTLPADKRARQLEKLQPTRESPSDECTGRSNSLCVTEQRYDADLRSVASSNDKMKELNADLDTVLNRLQQILTNNFAMDDSCFDNTQLRETANEMEGLLGTLIRGVEQRATFNANHCVKSTNFML